MAAAAGKSTTRTNDDAGVSQVEADIRQLKADIAKLTEQLAATGEHSYGAVKRAAREGVDQLKAQGEAAIEGLRSNARNIEDQVVSTVREKPITSLAAAAGIGFLFAMICRR